MTQAITSLSELSKAIKSAREERGLSQRELAKLSGIGNATISTIESGSENNINAKTLIAISNALDLQLTINA